VKIVKKVIYKCYYRYCVFYVLCRRTGTSLTFVTRSDWGKAKDLIDILVEANQVCIQDVEKLTTHI